MEDSKRYIEEERISIASVLLSIQNWVKSILSAWKLVFLGAIIIGGLFFAYQMLKKTTYKAETTFVLESDGGSGLGGQLSSLANLAGVNIGALTESSSLFQLDNIIELYKSYRMIKETLLTRVDNENNERLITRFGRDIKKLEKWNKLDIDFEIPKEQMLVRHDSVLKEVTEMILEKGLIVGKPSRKLSILSVAFESKNEEFAKDFNETLVSLVNDFYLKSKTKKTGENLKILTIQADSVKKVLDQRLLELARFEEENPNLNPLRTSARVPMQKLQIDVQSSAAVYQEIVKNLEIAKVAHRNNQPLIQKIDYPIFPLEDDRMKWYKALVIGLFMGGVIMVISLTIKSIYVSAMAEGGSPGSTAVK